MNIYFLSLFPQTYFHIKFFCILHHIFLVFVCLLSIFPIPNSCLLSLLSIPQTISYFFFVICVVLVISYSVYFVFFTQTTFYVSGVLFVIIMIIEMIFFHNTRFRFFTLRMRFDVNKICPYEAVGTGREGITNIMKINFFDRIP